MFGLMSESLTSAQLGEMVTFRPRHRRAQVVYACTETHSEGE